MKPDTFDGLRQSMGFAAHALGSLEQLASVCGRIDELAAFEARMLLLRCRLGSGGGSLGLLAEVRLFVAALEVFVGECRDQAGR